ncbi:MAG TPA: holo-ACP synthase [Ktedonobacterales bacterium]|jgi:holo-[acyl-carrier protein] synthase
MDTRSDQSQQNPSPEVSGSSATAGRAGALPGASGVLVGIDLVEVERIAQTVARFGPRFLERVFTPEELQESRRRVTWLAGRFAAKEACAKALGTGIGAAVAWRDVQVLRQPSGKPSLRLLGDAAARAAALDITQMDLSISHTHQYALAVVVALTTNVGGGSSSHPSGEAAEHPST